MLLWRSPRRPNEKKDSAIPVKPSHQSMYQTNEVIWTKTGRAKLPIQWIKSWELINCFKPLNSEVICYKAKISTNHFNKNPNNYHLPQAVSFLKIGTISNLSLFSFSLLRASLCLWYLPVLLSPWLGLTHCSLKLGTYVLPFMENIPLLSQVTPSLPFYFPHNFCRLFRFIDFLFSNI